jgi:hypothetical protein
LVFKGDNTAGLPHVDFVADPNPPITDEVKVLARRPGAKIAAIKAYVDSNPSGVYVAWK